MRQTLFLFFVLLTLTSTVQSQDTQLTKNEYVLLPGDMVALVVAAQPGCPIQLENARLLMNVQGKYYGFSYDVRNIGSKPILRWQTMDLTSLGTGGTLSFDENSREKILWPGEVAHEGDTNQTLPLTDELKKGLGLEKFKGSMVALLVDNVTFSDGTKYQDKSTVAAFRSYFEKLATDLNRLENLSRLKVNQMTPK